MYVVKRISTNKYLKFGSYSMAAEVDKAYKGTLYNRKSDAEKRVNSSHWINNEEIDYSDFQLLKVSFKYNEKIIK